MKTIVRTFKVSPETDARIIKAAAREMLDTGKTTSVSEWIRQACEAKLGERDG